MKKDLKAYWHTHFKKYPFIVVEKMRDWANGVVTSETYFQKVKIRATEYILIERYGAKEIFGEFGPKAIGAALAMQAGHDKWPHNPKLALKYAIEESIRAEDAEAFSTLKRIHEKFIGECPYSMGENISAYSYVPYEQGKGYEDYDEEEIENIKKMMDDEIEGKDNFIDEAIKKPIKKPVKKPVAGVKKKPVAAKKKPVAAKKKPVLGAKKKSAPSTQAGNKKLIAQLKADGFKSIRGWGSFWSKSGALPAQKKIENGRIVNVTKADQPKGAKGSAKQDAKGGKKVSVVPKGKAGKTQDAKGKQQAQGKGQKPQQGQEKQGQQQAGGQPAPRKVTVVDKGDHQHKLSKNGGLKLETKELDNVHLGLGKFKAAASKTKNSKEIMRAAAIIDKAATGKPISKEEMKLLSSVIRPVEGGKKVYFVSGGVTGEPMDDFEKYGKIENKEGSTIAKVLSSIGVPEVETRKSIVGNSKLKPNTIFTNQNGKLNETSVSLKTASGGISVNGQVIQTKKLPDEKKLTDHFIKKGLDKKKAAREAQLAIRAIDKYNAGLDYVNGKIKANNGELSVIDVLPGVKPDSPKNREKLANAAIDQTVERLGYLLAKYPEKKNLLATITNIKSSNGKTVDKAISDLGDIANDDIIRYGMADVVEIFSYVSALKKGFNAYMPTAGNFPLGDVIILPGEDMKLNTIDEIAGAIDQLSVSFESQSVKKDAGAASAAADKLKMSTYKKPTVKADLSSIDQQVWNMNWNDGKPKEAYKQLESIAKKHGIDLKKMLKDPDAQSTIASVHKQVMGAPAGQKLDKGNYLLTLQVEYLSGKMMEKIYNDNVISQNFSNEIYKVQGKGIKIDRSDGVRRLAYMKYSFNNKWSLSSGRPDTRMAGKMHNDDSKQ